MKWGVRRYQNKDGTLTEQGKKLTKQYSDNYKNEDYTLKKNTRYQRIGDAQETDNHKRTYVSYGKDDNLRYIGASAEMLAGRYKLTLKSVNPLKIAKGKTLIDTYLELYGETPVKNLIGVDRTYTNNRGKRMPRYNKQEIKERKQIYKNAMKNQYSFDKSFEQFNQDLMSDTKISNDYFTRLKNKGYNAMYDYNDRELAKNPLIVFDRGKDLKTIKISEISSKEYDDGVRYLEKLGYY